ncbi:MAG: serine/threonine-protein phosphatase [Prevotella sp.]|nr:serine/threonine-protein phosphatase [Prevotella sp.]
MKISIYPPLSIHEIGQRDNQEDSISQWDNRLFVLCDGMGGHEHGEVASQTVSQAIVEWYKARAIEPLTKAQIEDALAYAYAKLDEKDRGEFRKMGTTLTLLYIGSNGVLAAHMGDSRIYHIRPNVGVLYQSRDHSLVFDLFQSGEITYEEMSNFAQKNIVTRAMTPGEDNRMRPDIIHITDVKPGDYFYMCSDGMLEQMSNEELVNLLSSDVSDEEKRIQLLQATSNNQDNHSAWLIRINEVISGIIDESLVNEEPTARCNAINIIPKVSTASNEDDVVIVSQPETLPKKRNKWIRICASFLVAIFALGIIWTLFFHNDEKPELPRPKPMMQTPISPRYNNDTTDKDTNQLIQHESAGNKQQFNAQSRNHSTGHIQNR